MSQQPLWRNIIVLSTIATGLAFALSAHGDQKAGSSTFGTVDFQKLSEEYKAKDAVLADLRSKQTTYDARLQRRDQMPFLSDDEQKQLDLIAEKATKTDAETAKIKEFENKNKAKSDEIQTIRQKAEKDLTDADKAKLADADKTFRDAQAKFAQQKEAWQTELSNLQKSKSDELMTKIRTTIAKVAEQKSVAIVFNSDVALYAGTDITKAVVDELNKK